MLRVLASLLLLLIALSSAVSTASDIKGPAYSQANTSSGAAEAADAAQLVYRVAGGVIRMVSASGGDDGEDEASLRSSAVYPVSGGSAVFLPARLRLPDIKPYPAGFDSRAPPFA